MHSETVRTLFGTQFNPCRNSDIDFLRLSLAGFGLILQQIAKILQNS